MKIAYAKVGRSVALSADKLSNIGGDIECMSLLSRLIEDGHEVYIVGSHQGDVPSGVEDLKAEGAVYHLPLLGEPDRKSIGLPEDQQTSKLKEIKRLMNERVKDLPKFDAWLVWLGQHGNASRVIPKRDGTGDTTPLLSDARYTWPVMHAIESQDASPIWLCPDPRNLCKMRDSVAKTFARPAMAQYNKTKNTYLRDGGCLEHKYKYAAIELLAVPYVDFNPVPFDQRQGFGIMVNEGKADTTMPRKDLVKRWIIEQEDLGPRTEIIGHWSDEAKSELGIDPQMVPVNEVSKTLQRWRSTITFPAAGTGWATAKPWEAFAAGTVCFRHSRYDDQEHIFSRLSVETKEYLTCSNPISLTNRINELNKNASLWQRIVEEQRHAFEKVYKETHGGYSDIKKAIENV